MQRQHHKERTCQLGKKSPTDSQKEDPRRKKNHLFVLFKNFIEEDDRVSKSFKVMRGQAQNCLKIREKNDEGQAGLCAAENCVHPQTRKKVCFGGGSNPHNFPNFAILQSAFKRSKHDFKKSAQSKCLMLNLFRGTKCFFPTIYRLGNSSFTTRTFLNHFGSTASSRFSER